MVQRSHGFRRALLAAVFAVVGYLMMSAFVRQMLYPAPAIPVPSPPAGRFEEVALALPSGVTAMAWFHGRAAPGRPALVVLHGNGENLETLRLAGLLDDLARLDVAFLAVDYPGYGRSGGRPSEAANGEAAAAALAWLAARHPDRPRVVWGWSLGAAVAVDLAARRPDQVGALIALSPWTSLGELARVHFPGFLVRLLVRERYDSLTAARDVACPSLVIHGARDRIIPPSHGERLAAALPPPTSWLAVPGAGHNDLLGHPEVWRAVAGFLDGL